MPQANSPIYIQPEYVAARPTGLLTAVSDFRLTGISLITTEAARLYDAVEENSNGAFDLSSVRSIGFGRELIVPAVAVKLFQKLERFGLQGRRVSFGYGATETGLVCWTSDLTIDDLVASPADLTEPPAVGPVREGWSLRIVDDDGNRLDDGAIGNVEVFSEALLFSGYLDDPAANEAAFTPDGWFRTGDVGAMREDQLVLTGRKKFTLIVAGRNIALEPMESVALDYVEDGLVAAAPVRRKKSATDELALFFVPRTGKDIDVICRDIGREIARRWGVRVKHFIPITVGQFPRTRNGKVERGTLVALFRSGELKKYRNRRKKRMGKKNRPVVARKWIRKTYRKLTRLAAERGPSTMAKPVAPQPAEPARLESLPEIWQRILKLKAAPARDANFYDLGGDSLLSAGLIFEVEDRFSCTLPLERFFENPTIDRMESVAPDREPSGNPTTRHVCRRLGRPPSQIVRV